MLNEVVVEYLQRFNNVMTESVYASRGIDDYTRMKKYCDYLDYDSATLFQSKNKGQAGLRNIGNTCYLNVILQLLYHINYLREKICSTDQHKSKLIQLLRSLFGEMAVGKLLFADPSNLFDYLKSSSPDIFIPGVQNDFHQIFTLLIDKISESFKEISIEQSRFISKLLFGKLVTKIDFIEGKVSNVSTFNIINLEVSEGSFEKAFDRWKCYKINDFVTPKGSVVQASAENMFLQTPALLAFFINRVSFRHNKLEKDSRSFEFDNTILINKSQQSEKAKATSKQIEKELKQEKVILIKWLEKIAKKQSHLLETIKYLKEKEAPLISEPCVQNQIDEKQIQSAITYLEKQVNLITAKSIEVEAEVKKIDSKLIKLEEEGNYQSYNLWGLMIHEGASASYGHYKVCIHLGGDLWNEYNDRTVSSISKEKIQSYKDKGEICCLFYRRPALICDGSRIPVSHSLKSLVTNEERHIKKELDKARLLQSLYQQTESAGILLDFQMQNGIHDKFQYFFKTVHHAIHEEFPLETCKGIIIFDTISSDSFKGSLLSKFVSQQSNLSFGRLTFGIPAEYFSASEAIKEFLNKQSSYVEIQSAYCELASRKIKFNKKSIKERYNQLLEIIILKGIYYMKILSESYSPEIQLAFYKLSKSIDDLLANMYQGSQFALVSITIKSSIRLNKAFDSTKARRLRQNPRNKSIENYGEYFSENFKYWIVQRQNLSKLDQSNFINGSPASSYLLD